MADTQLAKLAIVISANTAELGRSLKSAQVQLKDFTGGIAKVGGIIAGAFAVREVASFALEVSKLAGEADGVEAAFNKLPNATRLMLDLKEATGNTVSELDLMKRTVQATNFGISLESLPKLLEFAAVRAQQTGQSVEYLVDSIVTGIGRKSPLILDNLGISATALKEKMGGVALATASVGDVATAVGKIAGDELEKMGGLAQTAALQQQQVSAAWDDTKVAIGRAVNATGFFQVALNGIIKSLNLITDLQDESRDGDFSLLAAGVKSGDSSALKDVINSYSLLRNELGKPLPEANLPEIIKKYGLSEEQGKRFLKIVREINGELAKAPPPIEPVPVVAVNNLEALKEKAKELNEAFEQIAITDSNSLAIKGQEIIAIGKQIEELEKLRKAKKDSAIVDPNTLDGLRAKLKGLNEEFDQADKNDRARLTVLAEQIAGVETLINRLEKLKKSGDFSFGFQIAPDSKGLYDPLKIDEGAVDRFKKKMKEITQAAKDTADEVKKAFEGMDLSGLLENALGGIGEAFGQALAGTASLGKLLLGALGGVLKQFGGMLISTGIGLIAIKKAFQSLNGYVAIAAGVALVALGSYFSSASRGIGNSMGGGGGGGSSAGSPVSRVSNEQAQKSIDFTAKFEIQGGDLVAVVRNQQNKSGRLGG